MVEEDTRKRKWRRDGPGATVRQGRETVSCDAGGEVVGEAAMKPSFQQSVDATRPHMLLTENTKANALLVYRYTDNGETIKVPNGPINQPGTVRAEVLRFYAEAREERASKIRHGLRGGAESAGENPEVLRLERAAAELRSAAARMVAAYRKDYPVESARMKFQLS